MSQQKSQQQKVLAMQRQVRKLQQAIASLGPLMRGSVVVIGTRNKQPYFSLNKDKRTRLIYLGQKTSRARPAVLTELQTAACSRRGDDYPEHGIAETRRRPLTGSERRENL